MTAATGIGLLLFLAACVSHGGLAASRSATGDDYNLDPGWRLHVGDLAGAEAPGFDDSQWKVVSLPHAWNEDSAFKEEIHNLPTGIAWHRKHFALPKSAEGQKVFIEFEGVRLAAEVWLNGQKLGLSENGVMAFGFDATGVVHAPGQDNVLAVRVDNSWTYQEKATGSRFQWNDRNFYANYGGINKHVYLRLKPMLYQTLPLYSSLGTVGVYVYATDFDIPGAAATIHAESEVKNDGKEPKTFIFRAAVVDEGGGRLALLESPHATTLAPGEKCVVKAEGRVQGLHFWSWGYGYLYGIRTALMSVDGRDNALDQGFVRTGFRKTAFHDGMTFLNDRAIQWHGYAQRTTNEWPALGLSVPAWLSDYSNRLMVQGNGNLVRWMHVTPWKQDVESCDRVGLIENMPAGDSEKDAQGRQWDQRVELMRDAIVYNRNNPSIVFYECGNNDISEAHMAEMKAVRDRFDPHGGRAIGSRNMLGSRVAEYGGEMLYVNKSAGIPLWSMEYSRDEGRRIYWDELTPPYHKEGAGRVLQAKDAVPPYNHNQDAMAIEDVARWNDYYEQRPGTGRRVSDGGTNIIFSDSNTHFRGEASYRLSGEVDAMRLPKDAYYADQVMWDGWVDVERPRLHLIGHWNYAPGTVKNVYAVSSADKVELFLNDRSLGFGKKSNHFLFTVPDVAWAPGKLRAVGYDASGKAVCEDARETAGEAAALQLTPMVGPGGLRADGADVALVQVEVVDAQGRRCPTALNAVDFTLSGPAEWRGGVAKAPNNGILATTLPVECGVNRVLIRSTPVAGKIVLTATSGALKPATIRLDSIPFAVDGGLARDLPGVGLPSCLDRGPTPAGPSFHVSRVAIEPARVEVGSNPMDALSATDDDESTKWTSVGDPAGAWIELDFAKPEPVNRVVMKLDGWRMRAYPLKITVDGKTAWNGVTPRSYGYVTCRFARPVTGSRLRVQLTGGVEAKDVLGLVEVTGKKEAAGVVGPGRTPQALGVVEIEAYRAPTAAEKAAIPTSAGKAASK
jgi:beta-galactosidase